MRDNPAELRYELVDDGEVIGEIRYRREPGAVALVHTEVDPAHEGRGLAGELVEGALRDLHERGLRVIPVCPFVRAWIRDHPEYVDAHGRAVGVTAGWQPAGTPRSRYPPRSARPPPASGADPVNTAAIDFATPTSRLEQKAIHTVLVLADAPVPDARESAPKRSVSPSRGSFSVDGLMAEVSHARC